MTIQGSQVQEIARAVKGIAKPKKNTSLITVLKPYLFLTPITIFVIMFSYYPFIKTFMYSLSTVNVRGEIRAFVGLKNYIEILSRPEFIQSFTVTFKFAAMYLPLAVIIPLALALIASKKKPFSDLYQTLYALPMAVSMAAGCLIYEQLYQRKSGLLNYALNQLGLMKNTTDIDWLNDAIWALPAILVIVVWLHMGFNFMLLLASVRNVPQELIESAELDGAGYWHRTFRITIPMVSPTIFFVICTQTVAALTVSGPILILTRGGPQNATSSLIYYIYATGFRSSNYTLGSTASIYAFIVTFIFLLINFLYEKKGVVYE